MTDYSVLMTVWAKDNPDHFRQSLQSIFDQTAPTTDLVLVEDGPIPPELTAVLTQFEPEHPEIHRVRLPENVGLGAALNAGLAHCQHELVARMDADDIAYPERCQLQLQHFAAKPELSIVGGYADEFIDDPDHIRSVKTVPLDSQAIYRFGKRRNPFIHPTVMYKKSTIEALGGYSTLRRGQDIELFSRLLYQGYLGENIPQALIKFRTDENLYRRRKSWKASKIYIGNIYRNWRMGYASFLDFLIAAGMRLTLLIIPLSWTQLIYRKILRKSRPGA